MVCVTRSNTWKVDLVIDLTMSIGCSVMASFYVWRAFGGQCTGTLGVHGQPLAQERQRPLLWTRDFSVQIAILFQATHHCMRSSLASGGTNLFATRRVYCWLAFGKRSLGERLEWGGEGRGGEGGKEEDCPD